MQMASFLLVAAAVYLQWLESKLSRGPGHVERAIKAALDSEPTLVFTTETLLTRVYGQTKLEKKHRVSVLRATKRVLQRETDWRMIRLRSAGSPLRIFNRKYIDESEIVGAYGVGSIEKR